MNQMRNPMFNIKVRLYLDMYLPFPSMYYLIKNVISNNKLHKMFLLDSNFVMPDCIQDSSTLMFDIMIWFLMSDSSCGYVPSSFVNSSFMHSNASLKSFMTSSIYYLCHCMWLKYFHSMSFLLVSICIIPMPANATTAWLLSRTKKRKMLSKDVTMLYLDRNSSKQFKEPLSYRSTKI